MHLGIAPWPSFWTARCKLQDPFWASSFCFCRFFFYFFFMIFVLSLVVFFLSFFLFLVHFKPIAKIRADRFRSARSNRAALNEGPAGGSWPRATFHRCGLGVRWLCWLDKQVAGGVAPQPSMDGWEKNGAKVVAALELFASVFGIHMATKHEGGSTVCKQGQGGREGSLDCHVLQSCSAQYDEVAKLALQHRIFLVAKNTICK